MGRQPSPAQGQQRVGLGGERGVGEEGGGGGAGGGGKGLGVAVSQALQKGLELQSRPLRKGGDQGCSFSVSDQGCKQWAERKHAERNSTQR